MNRFRTLLRTSAISLHVYLCGLLLVCGTQFGLGHLEQLKLLALPMYFLVLYFDHEIYALPPQRR